MNQKRFLKHIEPVKDKMYRLARRLLVSKEAAEDATQDVLVKLWRKNKELPKYNNLEAFAMTVTKNHCLDELRLKQNNNLRLVHSNYEDETTSLQRQIEASDELGIVEELLTQLPEQQQLIVQLREVEQMTYKEISEIMDMKETAIRVNLSRARATMRDVMKKIQDYGLTAD